MEEDIGYSRNLGHRFGMVAAVLALAALYLFFSKMLDAQHNPNANPQVRGSGSQAEVILQRNRQGHYVATGSINGEPVVFMLDTGATTIAVPAQIADELGLKRGVAVQVNSANGVGDAWLTRLNEVALGGLRLQDVRATISPGYVADEVLLGMNFLSQFDFSQQGEELVLRQPVAYD